MRSDAATESKADAEARFVEIVFPHHCNHLGTLFESPIRVKSVFDRDRGNGAGILA
ncbi:MAG: hypothetical protein ABIR10_04945 [Dokdonella sp.]